MSVKPQTKHNVTKIKFKIKLIKELFKDVPIIPSNMNLYFILLLQSLLKFFEGCRDKMDTGYFY